MSRTLLWDAGPGEVRAGLLEQGQLTEFRILRQRRDSAMLAVGEHFTARVVRQLGTNKALVTLGGGAEAVLQPARGHGEGTRLAVEMSRAPIPEPGRWKPAMVRPAPGIPAQGEPGWHFSDEPWVLSLRDLLAVLDGEAAEMRVGGRQSGAVQDLDVVAVTAVRAGHVV